MSQPNDVFNAAENLRVWTEAAKGLLIGRTIKSVRYMGAKEVMELGWCSRAVVITLDNGVSIYPSMDGEGNGAGALFTPDSELPTIPVI